MSLGCVSDTWMDVVKDKRGIVGAYSRGWEIVYSSDGYARVDGLSLLTPGETMIVQVQTRALPPEQVAV
jgi:hypothetical protein